MKNKTRIIILLCLCSLFLAGKASAAIDYQSNWWTVDHGGGHSQSANGQYVLNGTVGQPESGSAAGGVYVLNGGFWQQIGAAIHEFLIRLPLLLRSD